MSPRTKSKKLFRKIFDLDGSRPSSLLAARSNTILETASLSSTAGKVDQVQRELETARSTSRMMPSLRLSGPKYLSTMFLRYLNMAPCCSPTLSFPRISTNESGYQLWNSCPSCWNTMWFSSSSADTTTGCPTRLVLNIGAYLASLCRMKGGMSKEASEEKNWNVSPTSGRPMEPGGSWPPQRGFLHLRAWCRSSSSSTSAAAPPTSPT
ncbi:hypothetical protein EE612_025023 [Oryza sativa]|nr:hypothetical protein EE612_025023 [Oryza sativa]